MPSGSRFRFYSVMSNRYRHSFISTAISLLNLGMGGAGCSRLSVVVVVVDCMLFFNGGIYLMPFLMYVRNCFDCLLALLQNLALRGHK